MKIHQNTLKENTSPQLFYQVQVILVYLQIVNSKITEKIVTVTTMVKLK